LKGTEQTYILATFNGDRTTVTMGANRTVTLGGVLSYGTPPSKSTDCSHRVANAKLNIQSLNSDGKTWTTVATVSTHDADPDNPIPTFTVGMFPAKLTYENPASSSFLPSKRFYSPYYRRM